jgi:chromosome segregation ATPase
MSKENGKRVAIDGMNSDPVADGEKERPQSKRAKCTIDSDDDTERLQTHQPTTTPARTAKPASPPSLCNDEAEASDTSDAEGVAILVLEELKTSKQHTELSDPAAQQKEKSLSRAQRNPRRTVEERGTRAVGNNDFDSNKALKAKVDNPSLEKVVPDKHAEENTKLKAKVVQLEGAHIAKSQFIQGFIFHPWCQGMTQRCQLAVAAQQHLTEKLEVSEKEKATLKEETKGLQAENQQLTVELEAKEEENASLKEEIGGLQAAQQQLTKKLEASEKENASLKEKEGRLQAENQQLTVELEDSEEENASLKEEIGGLQADKQQLTQELDVERKANELSTGIISTLQAVKQQLKQKLEAERKVNASLKEEIGGLQAYRQTEELEAKEEENASLKEEIGGLQAENDQLTKKLEALEKENASLKEKEGRLQAENQQLKEQLEPKEVIDLTEDSGDR